MDPAPGGGAARAGNPGGGGDPAGGSGKMVLDIMKAGGLVVAGTDTPNAVNLHGELMAYTMAGMSAFDALKTATVNPAKALDLDAGTIEAGKLADLIVIDGDPLENIANTARVRRVIANGRVYDVNDLVGATHRRRLGDGEECRGSSLAATTGAEPRTPRTPYGLCTRLRGTPAASRAAGKRSAGSAAARRRWSSSPGRCRRRSSRG